MNDILPMADILPATARGSAPRLLLYSHDGQGLGHTRRNLAIAGALTAQSPDAAVLIVTGTDEVHRLGLPARVGVLKLPGVRKVANELYVPRRLNLSQRDMWHLRSTLLAAAVQAFRPDVLLADKHPLGVNGELRPALEVHRTAGGKTALGLRDILDTPATVLREWGRYDLHNRIAEHYDRVFIYGEQSVFDAPREYQFSTAMRGRTHYCGYVVDATERHEPGDASAPFAGIPKDRPRVLTTAGGGEDGFLLLQAFVQAAAGAPWRGIVVTGPLARPQDHDKLERMATEAGVSYHAFVSGLSAWVGTADALVCMGGYNSLVEALATGTPTVCVPRVMPRTEQLLRARAFERLGLLRLIEPRDLCADRLRTEITEALEWSRQKLRERAGRFIHFDGASRAATHLLELAAARVAS